MKIFLLVLASMTTVGPGLWRPLYPAEGEEEITVPAFELDEAAVTHRQFLEFVQEHPEWRRDNVGSLFADEGYLDSWAGPGELGSSVGRGHPVSGVSWWAARAYCSSRDARLPTEAEWELAAQASTEEADASEDPEHLAQILAWYSRPGNQTDPVAHSEPNFWGVYDLHGQVWEWVDDYASALVANDNREDGTVDITRFCGAGAITASLKIDYAAFMRIAFRSSLQADSTTRNLGFRCARDLPKEAP
ncbi:MAG: formylglycine-generating enzyme family protein [Proteobacteria bacterium]|nr:formylglycine-generating enzyme family protein [Pseudomonadota bacterium]